MGAIIGIAIGFIIGVSATMIALIVIDDKQIFDESIGSLPVTEEPEPNEPEEQ